MSECLPFRGPAGAAQRRALCLLLAPLIVAGCEGRPTVGPPATVSATSGAVVVAGTDGLPPPSAADIRRSDRPYVVGPFDKLIIDVFGIQELSGKEVQTDAGGRISFPLAGIIEAAGHTPGEIEAILRERLRGRYVRDPQVTVNLKETVSQVVTVDGQVREPGLYPVVGRMTLIRAIATAKGLDQYARLNDVVVFRTVNGQKMAALYDLRAIRRGVYADPEIYANDVVVVGDSPARRLFRDLLATVPSLAGPLTILLTR
ncbi:polysaccharide biosynthesis/export family protein [Sphingomonas sp.]|uniref:polysaccharide biosynthesis/export family protein n=1 Tax=Sphingomonas sp. TaxID=28214 RepID=UPI003CC5BD33